jgi:hypothetical protein
VCASTIPSVSRLRLALPPLIRVLGRRPPYHRIAETRHACVARGKCRRNSSLHETCRRWIRAKPRNRRKNSHWPKDKNNHNVRYLIPGGARGTGIQHSPGDPSHKARAALRVLVRPEPLKQPDHPQLTPSRSMCSARNRRAWLSRSFAGGRERQQTQLQSFRKGETRGSDPCRCSLTHAKPPGITVKHEPLTRD